MSEHPGVGELVRLFGLAAFVIFFGCGLGSAFQTARHTGIVPYFQQRLGEIETFARGKAIAKNCQALDELAEQKVLRPLSAFGFNDDFSGEVLTWHAPEEGLATVSGLLSALRASPQMIRESAEIIEELTAVEHALRIACERGVPFCLLLYTAAGTNAMEWEQRKGSCF